MKKQHKFAELSSSELAKKQETLLKQLIQFKVSLDPSVITEASHIDELRRDLKSIQRKLAQQSSAQTSEALGGSNAS